MERTDECEEITPPTKRKAGELFGALKTGGKGHCLRNANLIRKMRKNPKLMEYLQKVTYGTFLEKLERDIDGKIGIADFVKMVCHAKKPEKKKVAPSHADAEASSVDTLNAKIPDKECVNDDSNSNGFEIAAVSGESDAIHGVSAADHAAQPAHVRTPLPMIDGEDIKLPPSIPVVTDGAIRSAVNKEVAVSEEMAVSEEVVPDSTSVAIETEETGKSAVVVGEQEGPDPPPAKVLHYLCRSCRCTLFSERQLAHGQMRSCSSCFLAEPPSWMVEGLGVVSEKIYCPNKKKCKARLGQIKWVGEKCSCHEWIVPAIQIPKSRLDFKLK